MDKQEMTLEELREYIQSLQKDVIVRVTVLEDGNDGTESGTI